MLQLDLCTIQFAAFALLLLFAVGDDKRSRIYTVDCNKSLNIEHSSGNFVLNMDSAVSNSDTEPILSTELADAGNIQKSVDTSENTNTNENINENSNVSPNCGLLLPKADEKPIKIDRVIQKMFEGARIETFTKSGAIADGEVIFDYDGIVILKDLAGTFYVNSGSIDFLN